MTLKVSVIQQKAPSFDKKANLQQSAALVREAASQGAKLVLLQELHATAYFCQVQDPSLFDQAETLDGPTRQALEALAKELDVVLVGSIFEKRAEGVFHNTALVFDGAKGFAGFYRKMHIPDDPGFNEKYYFTPGDAKRGDHTGFAPIQTQVGKLGVLVCWDQWYPEAARLSALAGAQILLYPTAIGWDPLDTLDEQARQQEAWTLIQRSHAVANHLPVMVANRTGFEISPAAVTQEQQTTLGSKFWGSSFIAGQQGELLAKAKVDFEGALIADLDLTKTASLRRIWPYFRDRRIDAYAGLTERTLTPDSV